MDFVVLQPQKMIAASPRLYGMQETLQDFTEEDDDNLVEEAW